MARAAQQSEYEPVVYAPSGPEMTMAGSGGPPKRRGYVQAGTAFSTSSAFYEQNGNYEASTVCASNENWPCRRIVPVFADSSSYDIGNNLTIGAGGKIGNLVYQAGATVEWGNAGEIGMVEFAYVLPWNRGDYAPGSIVADDAILNITAFDVYFDGNPLPGGANLALEEGLFFDLDIQWVNGGEWFKIPFGTNNVSGYNFNGHIGIYHVP